MKKALKRIVLITVMLIALFFLLNVGFRIYCLIPIYNESVIERYIPYREDFELINNYIIENFDSENEVSLVVSWNYEENKLESLYCDGKVYYPDKEVKDAFLQMAKAFHGYDFSYIDITPKRITYLGAGEVMFVYSRNGKAPWYFIHPFDGVNFRSRVLWDGWYFLKTTLF